MLCIQLKFGCYTARAWYVVRLKLSSNIICYICHITEPHDFHFNILGAHSSFLLLVAYSFAHPLSPRSFALQIYNLCASRSCAYFTLVFFFSFCVHKHGIETGLVFSILSVYLIFGHTYRTQRRESLIHVYAGAE